jgi:four helix bundle protein
MFAHEKLHVYGKTLSFVAAASTLCATWNRKHAVVDQLDRASESLLLNLVDSARLPSGPQKLKALDYTLGSGLECAACFDIARIKSLLSASEATQEKERLLGVIKMLIGLRKIWEAWSTKEASAPYATALSQVPLFHHENLDAYRAALELMGWLVSLPAATDPPIRLYRQIDEAVTSIILNIAEASGPYSELDHRRFLHQAEGSAVKVAAYLDLAAQKPVFAQGEFGAGKALLERIVAMLSRM